MTSSDDSRVDPTLEIAERHLAILGELREMGIVVCRASAAASVAASHAVEELLADEYWQPETGRARALAGSKDAADAYQKATRSLRLTLMLEKTAAEWVRNERLGIRHPATDAGDNARAPAAGAFGQPDVQASPDRSEVDSAVDAAFARPERERPEFDRPDTLLQAPFRATIDRLRAELGAPVDWKRWKVGPEKLEYTGLQPRPEGWSECRPPAARALLGLPPLQDVAPARSP